MSMSDLPTFADLTTIGVGGKISHFIEPTTRVGFIEAVEDADRSGIPLCVIGGGSNMLVSDQPFPGVVIRDARRDIVVPDEATPVEGSDTSVHVTASAGANWDDFVAFAISIGLEGVEGLSGIPGTVGASVVQNIGAYGQEVSTSVDEVEVWDRRNKVVSILRSDELHFGYRTSALKRSMLATEGVQFFPTPRYIVLSVTFVLNHRTTGVLAYPQLAKALDAQLGERMDTSTIRKTVLAVRAGKAMLEDPARYSNRWMSGTKRADDIASMQNDMSRLQQSGAPGLISALQTTTSPQATDRHSCGSFFMNPQLSVTAAKTLPQDAPRFAATLANGERGVKTSAAWLIDHAGFHKGFQVHKRSRAALSSVHTLALTNLGGASAAQIWELAQTICAGVYDSFGIALLPEPVVVGLQGESIRATDTSHD